MDRTTIIRGPAIVKIGATELYSESDITVSAEIATTEGKNSVHGKYGEFMDTVVHKISFTPAPQASAAYFAALFPYGSAVLGASVFGASPPDLVVHSVDGKTYTYKVAALTQMPGLALGANLPLFDGNAEFTALGDCTEAWSVANHFVATADSAFASTSFNRALDLRKHYAAGWGASPWDAIETEGGIKIAFGVDMADVLTDSYGVVDKTITSVSATATFTPQGITPEQVVAALGIQGAGAARGRSMSAGSVADLVLGPAVDGEPLVTLHNCILKGNTTQFGAEANRVGELSLTTLRQLASGSLSPAFSVEIHTT